jgi:hypothetical protein
MHIGCCAGYDTHRDPPRDKSRYSISAFPDSTGEPVRYFTRVAEMPSTGNHFLYRGKIVDIGCARQPCIVWFNNSDTSYTGHAFMVPWGRALIQSTSFRELDGIMSAHIARQRHSKTIALLGAKLDSLETWSMSHYSEPRLMLPTYKDTPPSLRSTTIVQSRNLVVDDVNNDPSPVIWHVLLKTIKRRR